MGYKCLQPVSLVVRITWGCSALPLELPTQDCPLGHWLRNILLSSCFLSSSPILEFPGLISQIKHQAPESLSLRPCFRIPEKLSSLLTGALAKSWILSSGWEEGLLEDWCSPCGSWCHCREHWRRWPSSQASKGQEAQPMGHMQGLQKDPWIGFGPQKWLVLPAS